MLPARKRTQTNAAHPLDTLAQVLDLLVVWGSASSKVERGLLATSSLCGGQSEDGLVGRELDILAIEADLVEDKAQIGGDLGVLARTIWRQEGGPCQPGPHG